MHDDDHTPPAPGGPDDETREARALGGEPRLDAAADDATGARATAGDGRAGGFADGDAPATDDESGRTNARPDDATGVHAAPDDGPAVAPDGLFRSTSDRLLFGVCGGIAERYGFEPVLVRLVFLLTLVLGGAGVVFYLAAAILIPSAPATHPGPAPSRGAAGGALRLLVALAVAIAVVCALCVVAGVSAAVTVLFGAWPAAVALLLLGGLLLAWARSRRATGSLLVVALAVAVPAAAVVLSDARIERTAGTRDVTPLTRADAARSHSLGMGRMVLDLRQLDLDAARPLTVPARVDVGRLEVLLPRRRCVAWTVNTHIGVGGRAVVLGSERVRNDWLTSDGARRTVTIDRPRSGSTNRPRVTLDLRVGAGEIVVAQSRRALDGLSPSDAGVRGERVLRTPACRPAAERRAR